MLFRTDHFQDKFKALKEVMPEAKQIYIVGYDTFVRILDKKYYPEADLSKSGLGDFFSNGSLHCALRQDEKWGEYKAQKEYISRISSGDIEGVPSAWGQNIGILDLDESDSLGISSTRVREALTNGDESAVSRYITSNVLKVIREQGLYSKQDNGIKFPYLTRKHVLNCSFSAWHSKLKHISPRARIIKPLPGSFIRYLNEDGLMLPQDYKVEAKIEQLDSESDSHTTFGDEGFSEEDPTDAFQELHEQIGSSIKALGGSVVPKLNWSSPKDALWISADKTLKCTSPSDIYLLLKSSDFIVHDLEQAFESCDDDSRPLGTHEFELVLKKWFNAQPSMEFRCFVKESRLIAVSQRDVNFYDFLADESPHIMRLALSLVDDHLRSKFPDPNCRWTIIRDFETDELVVFDMYVSVGQDKAWVMDINPFSPNTDPLLFQWKEVLNKSATEGPEIRLVSPNSVMSQGPQYSAHQVPYELIDNSDGVDPATFTMEFQQKLAKSVFDN